MSAAMPADHAMPAESNPHTPAGMVGQRLYCYTDVHAVHAGIDMPVGKINLLMC